MFPVLFKIGPLTFHTYGLMVAIGFLTAMHFMQRDAKKAGINPEHILTMGFWILILGIAGTRIAHIIMYPDGYSWSNPWGWIAIWEGGLVFQGALPPALLFYIFYCRKHKLPMLTTTDIIFPYIPLGHAFGRIGCLMYSCCYGAPTSVPWAIRFPHGSEMFNQQLQRYPDLHASDAWSLPVHPTQIYGSVGLFTLCLILLLLRKRLNPFPGFVMCMYFLLYGVGRFIVEFYRGDHNPNHLLGNLSDQQVFALAGAAGALVVMLVLYGWSRAKGHNSAASR